MSYQTNRGSGLLLAVVLVLGGLVILLVLGTPMLMIAVQAAREAAKREECEENLAKIGQALQNYHSQHSGLPLTEDSEVLQPGLPGPGRAIRLGEVVGDQVARAKRMEGAKTELAQQAAECGLSRIWPNLEKELQPSIRMTSRASDGEQMPIGVSKIGGLPDLPAGTEWPRWNGVPLAFIAQLNMIDATKYDWTGSLPTTGLLYFFYDARQETWGFDPKDRESWRVLFFDDGRRVLQRAQRPEDLPEHTDFAPCRLEFSAELTLPPWDSGCLEQLKLSDEEIDRYFELLEKVSGEGGVIHRLLGHPDQIQGEMQLQCQLTFHGLYTGNSTGYEDPRAAELEPGAADWLLLLQIDSDEKNAGMMWGDVGRLYFWIRKDDLEKRAFENVWMVLQCY
jgi:uncharacterized protein YwqG